MKTYGVSGPVVKLCTHDMSGSENDNSDNDSIFTFSRARKYLWRVSSLFFWVWLTSPFIYAGEHLAYIRWLDTNYVLILFLIFSLTYVLTKKRKTMGCVWLILGYPIYVILFPVSFLIYTSNKLYRIFFKKALNTDSILPALIPYFITFLSILYLYFSSGNTLAYFLIVALSLNICFIIFSLLHWIFSPLGWVSQPTRWLINTANEYVSGMLTEDHSVMGYDLDQSYQEQIKNLTRDHKWICKIPNISSSARDWILTAGFIRKYFVSVVHTSTILAIILYIYNTRVYTSQVLFSEDLTSPIQDVFFDYFYFTTMNIITGDTTFHAVSSVSQTFVLVNSLIGVLFLVILITTFSMLTRENAKEIVGNINQSITDLVKTSELKILKSCSFVCRHDLATKEIVDAYGEVEKFKVLRDKEFQQLKYMITFERYIRELIKSHPKEASEIQERRKSLGSDAYAKLCDRVVSRGMDDPTRIIGAITALRE